MTTGHALDADDRVQLRPDVRIHVVDDYTGFVETATEVRRVQGNRLTQLLTPMLTALEKGTTMKSIADSLASETPAAEARELIEGLYRQGLLMPTNHDITAPQMHSTVLAAGTDQLLRHARLTFSAWPGVNAVVINQRTTMESLGTGLTQYQPDLVVIATDSILDPWAAEASRLCIDRNQSHLVFGLGTGDQSFVSPVWSPRADRACYACMRTRRHMNSPSGETIAAYQRYLARSGRVAMSSVAVPARAAHLSSLACLAANRWLRHVHAPEPGQLLWLDGDSDVPSTHLLLPVSTCDACADRQSTCMLASEPSGIEAAVDDAVGIVHSVSVKRVPGSPPIYVGRSMSSNLQLLNPAMQVTINSGAGHTRAAALHATLGESLERYAAGLYRPDDLTLSIWRDLDEPAVAPATVGLFSADQYAQHDFPFAPFTENTPVRWVPATRLSDQRTILVPAFLVYLPYRRVHGEASIAPSISTGLAAGSTREAAILSGLYEVLERDALAISWLHRLPPRPVPDAAIAAAARAAAHWKSLPRSRVRFYDVSLDVAAPTVFAVLDYRSGRRTLLSVGSACRATISEAIDKAYLEAVQAIPYIRQLLKGLEAWEVAEDFVNVDSFPKHVILYNKHPKLRERLDYLLNVDGYPASRPLNMSEPFALSSVSSQLEKLVVYLDELSFQVYVVDMTTSDMAQLGVPVVRVLVPGLQHLSGIHRYRLLGTPRLHQVASALGTDSRPDNPFPHPMP